MASDVPPIWKTKSIVSSFVREKHDFKSLMFLSEMEELILRRADFASCISSTPTFSSW